MNYFRGLLIVGLCLLFCNTCKQFELDGESLEELRVKKIIEYNGSGEEISWDIFIYTNDKLTFWKKYNKDEYGEMSPKWKCNITYGNDQVSTTSSFCLNDSWVPQQQFEFKISNKLIQEKLVSRLNDPKCDNCWKYKYIYRGSQLTEWKKYIKSEDCEWQTIRKDTYCYQDGKLVEQKDSVNYNNTHLILDYKKEYTYHNNKLSGWEGGTWIEGAEWKPTQKVEYSYQQDLITEKTYSVRSYENDSWNYFGSKSYFYNDEGYLVEETSSSGNGKRYEYETGCGNAALLYCMPEENDPFEPMLKSVLY